MVYLKITASALMWHADRPAAGPLVGAAWVHVLPWEMMLSCRRCAISFGPAAGDAGDRDAAGRKLSVKELGRDSAGAEEPALCRRRAGSGFVQPAAAGVDCPSRR